jgi:hypothetical protein
VILTECSISIASKMALAWQNLAEMRLSEEVAPRQTASLMGVPGPKWVVQHPPPLEASASTCHACFVAEFAVLW